MTLLKDRDFLSALVLFAVGIVSLSEAGDDVRNWIFPLLATYLIIAIGAALAIKAIVTFVRNNPLDLFEWQSEDSTTLIDLLVFGVIVLGYILVMYGLGFWLASFIMLTVSSIYMTVEKSPRNLILAVVVPALACIVAYVVFLHVFYVPLPEARWWAGFR